MLSSVSWDSTLTVTTQFLDFGFWDEFVIYPPFRVT